MGLSTLKTPRPGLDRDLGRRLAVARRRRLPRRPCRLLACEPPPMPVNSRHRSIVPAGRTGDGSIGRLGRSGGIVSGDAATPAPSPVRTDRDPAGLPRLARRERDGRVSARLLARANAFDGLPREEAARLA